MPIRISPVIPNNTMSMKNAIETIARNASSLQNPSEGDSMYVSSVPGVNDLEEGQGVFYFDGTNYRIYFKINGVIKFVALS